MQRINRSIFKAYDIRGHYPDELNEPAAEKIALALAGKFKKGKVVIGRDARLSSLSIYKSLRRAFDRAGFEVEAVGLCTTPMFYFLANKLKAVGGVMVTASHAPKEFNGLKVVGRNGEVVSGTEILALLTE